MQFLVPLIPTLSAVLAAVLADILLRFLPQARDRLDPLFGIPARMASRLEAKLNRPERRADVRAQRGIVTLAVMMLVALALALLASSLSRLNVSLEPVFWFLCLHVTFPWTSASELLRAWKNDAADNGLGVLLRRRVPVFVETKNPDRFAMARMLTEAAATALSRGYLTPILWGIAAVYCGIPSIAAAVFVTALLEAERVICTLDNADAPFAKPFHVIEAILNFVPSRVAGLLWVLAACFTPGGHPGSALSAMFRQSESFSAVNRGWPVAAVAGALRVALPSGRKRTGWISPEGSTAKMNDGDVQRLWIIHAVALGLSVLIFTATLFLALGS